MGILSWMIVGAIAGWLACAIFGIKNPVTGINVTTIIVSSVGAIAVLYIVKILRR